MRDTLVTLWTARGEEQGQSPETVSPAPTERYSQGILLGRGGMGEVWRVHDHLLHRDMVRKVLRADLVQDQQAIDRFTNEARITAHLQHPGVVPVYDIGALEDGRPYYTMEEVRGPRLTDLLQSWSTRRLISALQRVADVLALAHERGVVHRDLKPENIMLGEFGSVIVLDWGIASARAPVGADLFRGMLVGTGAYLAPEMARREFDRVGPASDVYQLGCMLREVITQQPPRQGPLSQVLHRAGSQPLTELTLEDTSLQALCKRAVAWEPQDRFPDGRALSAALVDWLDGADRRGRALVVIQQAQTHGARAQTLRTQAAALSEQAAELLAPLKRYDPASAKQPGWALEDTASEHRAQATLEWDHQEQLLQAALRVDPECALAHAGLAEIYQSRHASAEAASEPLEAQRWEQRLRAHSRGHYQDYLLGQGHLSLHSEPTGAHARLFRYTLLGRRLVPELVAEVGQTPLSLDLPQGSYLVELSHPQRATVRVPVWIERQGEHLNIAPGERQPTPIPMPKQLSQSEAMVAPGYFTMGGDPQAADGLPRRRVWVPAFVMQRDPVTLGRYLEFLNHLVDSGQEVASHVPKPSTQAGPGEQDRYGSGPNGRFLLVQAGHTKPWSPDLPVTDICWHSARAYCAWRAQVEGLPWRLPHSVEWQKAARGVDGRHLPWGEHLEPTWACTVDSVASRPDRVPVQRYPQDLSPYGVRGLVGNVRDLCLDSYRKDGPELAGERLSTRELAPPADAEAWRNARGGCAFSGGSMVRPSTRLAMHPDQFFSAVGFRMARSL